MVEQWSPKPQVKGSNSDPREQLNIPKPGESKETKALTMISPRKQI
jgi:hypothetical protein